MTLRVQTLLLHISGTIAVFTASLYGLGLFSQNLEEIKRLSPQWNEYQRRIQHADHPRPAQLQPMPRLKSEPPFLESPSRAASDDLTALHW